jgi:hypothetical protein
MIKNAFFLLLASGLMLAACNDTLQSTEDAVNLDNIMSRECAAMDVLEAQLTENPSLQSRMDDIEAFTHRAIERGEHLRIAADGVLEIPVIVNVIYRTASENISMAQIQSQIDVLNEDFNATNADISFVPSEFQGVTANVGIRFVLEGVNRKYANKRSWSTNDDMKRSNKGGIDPTDPSTYLNMWVVNNISSMGRTILGYAQFPGGNPATDGVVMGHNYFGRVGVVSAPFDRGRTTTHEVGHWMNLRHIWGDATCGNDFVADTPVHNTANYGCPTYPHFSTCAGTPLEMTMNYMDYTNDNCMYMFSDGQKARMLAVFAPGGPRASMGQ